MGEDYVCREQTGLKQSPIIEQQMSFLGDQISGLSCLMDKLISKIGPVLGPDEKSKPKPEEKEPATAMSPLAGAIAENRMRVSLLQIITEDTIQRIQL